MMGQRVVVLWQPIGTQPLDGLRDAFMQDPPPLDMPQPVTLRITSR